MNAHGCHKAPFRAPSGFVQDWKYAYDHSQVLVGPVHISYEPLRVQWRLLDFMWMPSIRPKRAILQTYFTKDELSIWAARAYIPKALGVWVLSDFVRAFPCRPLHWWGSVGPKRYPCGRCPEILQSTVIYITKTVGCTALSSAAEPWYDHENSTGLNSYVVFTWSYEPGTEPVVECD